MNTSPSGLLKYLVFFASGWTIVILASFVWLYTYENRQNLEIAKAEARIAFQKDTLYRTWAARHGGVYAPVSPENPPNPNLSHIPERDITTPSGKPLTLINPAYMTRQVFEQADKESDYVKGHITSLKPIRPENSPDPWERTALSTLEKGENEVSSIQVMNGQKYLRLMRPFITDQPCLKCHAAQGYKRGDIRGGISVSVPMRLFSVHSSKQALYSALGHGSIWLLGLTGILWGGRRLNHSYTLLHEKNIELQEEVFERQSAQEQLQEQSLILEEEIADREQIQEQLEQHVRLVEQEIAARTLSEKMLQEAYAFDQQILNNPVVGIIVYNKDHTYRVWNRFMEELTGVPANDVLGKKPTALFPFLMDQKIVDRIERALAGESVEPVEFRFEISSTGKKGFAYDLIAPLRDTDGMVIGVVAMVLDITKQQELEIQLRQAQKMEAIGHLAGGVAHDFNNILQVISGYGTLLKMGGSLNEKEQDEVDQILAASERATQLTRSLLTFSRKQEMKFSVVDLNAIVDDVNKFLIRIIGEDIQLKVAKNCNKLVINADHGQIEQVLINLTTNARDAMRTGGLLSIETGMQMTRAPAEQESEQEKNYAVLTVSDTGIGMDAEICKRLFEPFFTTKEVGKGTGLGMAIVYGIIKQHNGFINVSSEPGFGTTFKIFLPLYEAEQATQDKQAVQAAIPKGGNETILLAEDDISVRALAVSILSQYGYSVIQAADGEEALRKYTEQKDEIDLVLMDMIMPKMNGIEVYDAIRKIQPDVKVLFASGYTAESLNHRGVSEEGIELIMKPLHPMELLHKLREVIERPGPRTNTFA